jgi:hypothetical protein
MRDGDEASMLPRVPDCWSILLTFQNGERRNDPRVGAPGSSSLRMPWGGEGDPVAPSRLAEICSFRERGDTRAGFSFVPLQLPLSPMGIFAIRIELAHDMTIQSPHDANARKHRRAVIFDYQQQRFDRSLPLRKFLFGLRKLLDATSFRPRGSGTGSSNGRFQPLPLMPRILFVEPLRGNSPFSGTLHHEQGAPAAPQGQACSPAHGLAGWLSHTQPKSSHRVHFMASRTERFILAVLDSLAFGDPISESQATDRSTFCPMPGGRSQAASDAPALRPFCSDH